MQTYEPLPGTMTRRRLLGAAGAGSLSLLAAPAFAQDVIDLRAKGGPSLRPLVTNYPQKGRMILQRTSPPWLETPFDIFDKGVFTPNDQHFVSWHWADIPENLDLAKFRLTVRGHVDRPLSLSLGEILHDFHRVELAAVSQCAGNSRIYMQPRVAGAQWANGSMSNALWTGVALRDILDRAGVKAGAIQVRFGGLDQPVLPGAPKFLKSLTVDHARDGEVMVAFGMNGEQLPLLNGFPLKLVVPGWCGVYWIKMLNDIEVLDQPDTNYWTAQGYRIPDAPHANVQPGETGYRLIPVTRNVPRSFITNVGNGDTLPATAASELRGIAFGGDCGVAKVDLSIDGGKSWLPTQLGKDEGKYSFRQWQTQVTLATRGAHVLKIRCTNTKGEAQPDFPIWNPAGYMMNTIEQTHVIAA